ncbi:Xaa-Pro peptidase family protein [Deinococcus rubellus]
MQQSGVDALWISQPANIRYLSGFSSPEDAKLLLTPDAAILYTDSRYALQAAQEVKVEIHIARSPATLEHAAEWVQGLKVGFEAEHLTVAGLDDLKQYWQAELVPLRRPIETLRLVKSDAEIAMIRRAQAIADAAYAEVLPQIRAGARETDLSLALELAMRRLGADGPSFETIVASGERGALPHGRASDKLLVAGELVTLDFGALIGGYHSDMTRTVPVGEVSAELRRLYMAVLDAEDQAIAAVGPGVRTADLDALARGVLAGHDLAEHFTHSLGHGVGLDIHEGPGLRAASDEVLRPGMVITIEPGVYLEGVGGVRIEDLLLITESGHEVLSQSSRARL